MSYLFFNCLKFPFQGVGYCVVTIALFTDFFYNVVICWSLYYFIASFSPTLPWTSCNNSWNTETCTDAHLKFENVSEEVEEIPDFNLTTYGFNASNVSEVVLTYPAEEFYK